MKKVENRMNGLMLTRLCLSVYKEEVADRFYDLVREAIIDRFVVWNAY